MADRLGKPPVWLLDIRPFAPFATAVIQNHEVADQVARASKEFPYSTPRASTLQTLPLLGTRSLFATEVNQPSHPSLS